MKRISAAAVICAAAMLCCSCYDSREIDETAYIIAVGLDPAEDGEFRYTFQFAAPNETDGGGDSESAENGETADSGNPSVKNVVIKAPDFYVAKNMINNFLSKNIDMSHLKMIVFSESADADARTMHSQLFLHEREIRPHTAVAAAERSAEEYLRCVNPEPEINTAKYYELMSLRSNNIYAPSKRLRDFVDESADGGDSVLPIACVANDETEDKHEAADENGGWIESGDAHVSSLKSDLRGMTVFKGGSPVGEMSGDSALVFNILKRDIKKCTVSVRSSHKAGETVTFRIFVPCAAEYRVSDDGGRLKIGVEQRLNAEYIGGRLPDGYSSYDELFSDLETAAKQRFSDFLYSSAHELNADILGIGKKYRSRFLTWSEMEDFGWEEKFSQADFDVKLQIVREVE